MKISTWNVNSVRARIENIKIFLKKYSPDILLLQEIKTEEVNYPFDDLKNLGYFSYVHGQKSYNGVAILSKKELTKINKILSGDQIKQSRLISAIIKIKNREVELINIYVPNGNPIDTEKYSYKIDWLNLLTKSIEKKIKAGKEIILAGDFNIIPEEIDVYDPNKYINDALFKLEIRKKFRTLINLGMIDAFRVFNNQEGNYTFWDYMKGSWPRNNGLRIDHILISNGLINLLKNVEIVKKIRSQIKPSDHVPLEATFT